MGNMENYNGKNAGNIQKDFTAAELPWKKICRPQTRLAQKLEKDNLTA